MRIRNLNALIVIFGLLYAVPAFPQSKLPENVQRTINLECSEHEGTSLHSTCLNQSEKAYESWRHFISDPEFEKVSEIISSCSVDWTGYIMRVECVKSETKALVRMNDLVNVHKIDVNIVKKAMDSCNHAQDMGYSVLEMCIREEVADITGEPLP